MYIEFLDFMYIFCYYLKVGNNIKVIHKIQTIQIYKNMIQL